MNTYNEKYKVVIQGISPLIIHKYVTGTVSESGTTIGAGNTSLAYKDEWKKTTYLNDKGNLVMPSVNLLACMFKAGGSMRKGKFYVSRLIYPSLRIDPFEPEIKFDNKTMTLEDIEANDWTSTTGAVVAGSRIDRIRTTLLPGWTIEFNIFSSNDQLNKNDIKHILSTAGFVAGLGDSRPSAPKKPGPFGRFDVTTFESD